MDANERSRPALTPPELADAWRILARRDGTKAADEACARIDQLADAGALQATFDAAENVEPDSWEGLAELRAVVAADLIHGSGRDWEARLMVIAVAGAATAIDALPRDAAAWKALHKSLDESGLFGRGTSVLLLPYLFDPVSLAGLPLDGIRDITRSLGHLAVAQSTSERVFAEAEVVRLLSWASPPPVDDPDGAEIQTVRALVGVRVQLMSEIDDAGDLLSPGNSFDEPRSKALASAWQAEAYIAVGCRDIHDFSIPAPWEDAFMVCGLTHAALCISMEEELDGDVPEDGTEKIHVCADPGNYGLLVSRVRRGFVSGPVFVPGVLVHTRMSEFIDLIGTEENPAISHDHEADLPKRNPGGRVH